MGSPCTIAAGRRWRSWRRRTPSRPPRRGRAGVVFVDNSPIKPDTARRMAAALSELGVAALDAPVSGGEVGARAGTLAIMVGGPAQAFEAVLPILQSLGKTITYVGESGAGQGAKACHQLMVSVQMVAMGELLLLA